MEEIAVSVIVPIYNVESWLGECLDSLEKQTLKNIEVILINDGSTDGSRSIAEKYVMRNNNFILIDRENGGLSAARNSGLEKATGKYVYFLDSDDYLLENALEILYVKACRENLDVLKFAAYTFTEPFRKLSWTLEGYKYKGSYTDVYRGIVALQLFIDNDDTSYPSCCLILTKRETIEKNGLRFYEGIIHEDNLFHYQLMALSNRTAVLNEPLYCRRYRAGSITQTPDWLKKNRAMCISAKEADKFVKKHPEIEGKTSDWYIMFFINMMIENWENMTLKMQKSTESKRYLKETKPIAKRYNYGGSLQTRLFFMETTVYKLFKWIVAISKKVLCRQKI